MASSGVGVGGAAPQPPLAPPPPGVDPYPAAKRAAEDLLSAASDLQADAFAGRGPGAVAAWRASLKGLDAHVAALEAAARAMVADPARFGLDAARARLREGEVAGLRYAADDLRRAADQLKAGGGGGARRDVELGAGGGGGGGGGGAYGGGGGNGGARASFASEGFARRDGEDGYRAAGGDAWDPESGRGGGQPARGGGGGGRGGDQVGGGGGGEDGPSGLGGLALGAQQQQRQIVARQDAALDEISLRAEGVRRIGLAMHEELESQAQALDELGADVDASGSQVRSLRRRAADVLKRSGADRQLCTIAFLVGVLVVLTVLAIA